MVAKGKQGVCVQQRRQTRFYSLGRNIKILLQGLKPIVRTGPTQGLKPLPPKEEMFIAGEEPKSEQIRHTRILRY